MAHLMPRGRFLAPLLLCALAVVPVASCGGKQMKAQVEYPKGTDYSQYQSYRWLTEDLVLIQSGTGNENIRNVENEKRVRAAVDRELAAKGLTKTGEEADLVVAFTVGTKVRYRVEGGDRFSVVTGGPGEKVTRGTLTLYFFDPKTKTQVWEAWTSKDLSPTENPDDVVNAAVGLLMKEFPPGE